MQQIYNMLKALIVRLTKNVRHAKVGYGLIGCCYRDSFHYNSSQCISQVAQCIDTENLAAMGEVLVSAYEDLRGLFFGAAKLVVQDEADDGTKCCAQCVDGDVPDVHEVHL